MRNDRTGGHANRTTPKAPAAPPQPQDPTRCPYCNSPRVRRKGTRQKKMETVTQFRCAACGRTFRPGPRAIRNRTYPINEILEALTLYNRGYSLAETATKISSRFGHPVSPSTISRWLARHPDLITYRRIRDSLRARFHPSRIIATRKLYHRQVYEFAWHRGKAAFLENTRLVPLATFLENVPTTCPHDLFRREDGARGSQLDAGFLRTDQLIVAEKQNAATAMAGLIIPSVGTNHERHPKLQRFMLANDQSTVAVEVPIWLDEEDIAALEGTYSTTIIPTSPMNPDQPIGRTNPARPRHITGHIDFLQVRNGSLHILDYKPDARTNRPIAQLTIYSLALTRLVAGLRLFDIKCAWFNEYGYNEIFPRKLLPAPVSCHPASDPTS